MLEHPIADLQICLGNTFRTFLSLPGRIGVIKIIYFNNKFKNLNSRVVSISCALNIFIPSLHIYCIVFLRKEVFIASPREKVLCTTSSFHLKSSTKLSNG
jgi:hypothetical protein